MSDAKPRGFAAMTPEQRKAIASKGGKAAHKSGVAYQWTSDQARQAGLKGGRAVSRDSAYMAAIGRKGAEANKKKKERSQCADAATNPAT